MADKKIEELIEEFPVALTSPYGLGDVNSALTIDEQEVSIESGRISSRVKADFSLDWLPHPQIRLRFNTDLSNEIELVFRDSAMPKVVLPSGETANLQVSNSTISSTEEGPTIDANAILHPVDIGNPNQLTSITGHIPNFLDTRGRPIRRNSYTWKGRTTLQNTDWRIIIDKVDNYSLVYKELKQKSGFAITHLFSIERVDKCPFDVDSIEPILESL